MTSQPRPTPQQVPCRYIMGKVLGKGTYSVVREATHIETGQSFAAKVISKRLMKGREHMVKNEIIVLKRVSQGNKNILALVDYFETPNNLYLITDVARGDELFDRIYNKGSFYESDAVNIIQSIVGGVAYLHQHGIVHRDLKPENLLFRTMDEDSDLLIADFGLSRIIDEEKFHMLMTTCGTPAYMAPEIFRKSGHGKPVDVWAIGVITYFLLCGYTPFDRDSSAEEMQAILACDYSFEPEEYWEDVSAEAKDFISKCLQSDIEKRITAEECLQHKFLDKSRFGNNSSNNSPAKDGDGDQEMAESNGNGKNGGSSISRANTVTLANIDTDFDTSAIPRPTSFTGPSSDDDGSSAAANAGHNGKPKKKESDLLPTVKSNLSLRRLTGSSQDGMGLSSMTMMSLGLSPLTPLTPAAVPGSGSGAASGTGNASTTTSTSCGEEKVSSASVTKPIEIPQKNDVYFQTLSDNQTMDGAFSKSPEIKG